MSRNATWRQRLAGHGEQNFGLINFGLINLCES